MTDPMTSLLPPVYRDLDGGDLAARVERLEQELDELHAALTAAPVAGDISGAGPLGETDLVDLDLWVRTVLLPAYCRYVPHTGGPMRWCASWWQHPEAVSRLDAVRRAGEVLLSQGGAYPSLWWREHVDHHLLMLLSPDGPFAGCSPAKHAPASPLPAMRIPAATAAGDSASRPDAEVSHD